MVKNQNTSISQIAPNLKHAIVGLGWNINDTTDAQFDLDASCFLLNDKEKLSKPLDFIFYNNTTSTDGSVVHCGDNRTGEGEGDDEQLTVDLSKLSADVKKIAFVVSIHDAQSRGQNFGMVESAYIRIVDADTGQEILKFNLTENADTYSCMIFGELYRHKTEWKFKAIEKGMTGLDDALRKYAEL